MRTLREHLYEERNNALKALEMMKQMEKEKGTKVKFISKSDINKKIIPTSSTLSTTHRKDYDGFVQKAFKKQNFLSKRVFYKKIKEYLGKNTTKYLLCMKKKKLVREQDDIIYKIV